MSAPLSPLNKSANRARERAERERERLEQVAPLEPDFPFVVMPFDPDFFGVGANPPEKPSKEP